MTDYNYLIGGIILSKVLYNILWYTTVNEYKLEISVHILNLQ